MAEYKTNDTELGSIANAIRTKGGTTASSVYPQDFVSAINAISTGGGGESTPNLQAKAVTSSTATQTVRPDTSYDGLSQVTVNAYTTTSKTVTSSTATQTVTPGSGYNALSQVVVNAIGTGSVTPTASKGTVSNHQISITPKATVTAGYVSAGTPSGTAVTVSASELVSGSQTVTTNSTYDVTNLASMVVNVSGSGASKNTQIVSGVGRVAATAYTAVSGQSITVAKTGTYDVYWCGYRSSASGTNGSQLYIDSTAYGSAQTTFNSTYTNWQIIHLSSVSLTQGQVITVRARSRGTNYYMYVADLTIIEQ